MRGQRAEEDIDGRAIGCVGGLGGVAQRAAGDHRQMIVGAGDQHLARVWRVVVASDPHRALAHIGHPGGQTGGEVGGDVLGDDDRRVQVFWNAIEHLDQRVRSAGGGSEGNDRQVGMIGFRRSRIVAQQTGFDTSGLFGPIFQLHDCGDLGEQRCTTLHVAIFAEFRSFDRVHGSVPHRFEDLGKVAPQRRADDQHGGRAFAHDATSCFGPIHDRHQHVHEDEIGAIRLTFTNRLRAIASDPADLVTGDAADDTSQSFGGQQQIINDGDSHDGQEMWWRTGGEVRKR